MKMVTPCAAPHTWEEEEKHKLTHTVCSQEISCVHTKDLLCGKTAAPYQTGGASPPEQNTHKAKNP